MDKIWKQPENSEAILSKMLERNKDLYQFEKMLEETAGSPINI